MLEFQPVQQEIRGDHWSRQVFVRPAFHLEEITIAPAEEIPGYPPEAEINPDWRGAPRQRFRHRSLHRAPRGEMPGGFFQRGDARPVSRTFGDCERDWDFIIQHRDKVLRGAGLGDSSPAIDKVRALAEDIWRCRRAIRQPGLDLTQETPWSHPADTLCYGSWCVGAANAMVALCATLGISARTCGVFDHTMSEVLIDGKWIFVENASSWLETGGVSVFDTNWASVISSPQRQPGCSVKQRMRYWEMAQAGYHFPQPDGLFGFCGGVAGAAMTPQTAATLYPEWGEPVFKSYFADRYDLAWGQPGPVRPLAEMTLRPGQMCRRRFWLGSLANTREIQALLCFSHESAPQTGQPPPPLDPRGGHWFIAVNEHRHPIRQLGGWALAANPSAATWVQKLSLPLGELIENGWNTLGVGCPSGGAEVLQVRHGYDALLPPEPVWCDRVDG